MATEAYRLADVKGLTPAIDPTRSGDQFALNGRNYIFDALGPKSAFGNRLLLPQPLLDSNHVQAIRLKLRSGDRCFTFTHKAILEWREDTGGWRVIYVTDDTSVQPYRWTWGFLSNYVYFCHPVTGIIIYGLDDDSASALRTEGAPTDALAICVDNGRLVAITPEFLFWSDPSDGTNFIPKLGGAGFQKLAARVPGYPVMVSSYAKGVLTWTTGGVLRSDFTGDQETYRHRALNTEYRPINSFCVFQSDENTVVILDERGFFKSSGEPPTPYTALFNEFLITWLQENRIKLSEIPAVRLEWDDRQRLLYMSYSMSRYDAIYEEAFVLYPPTDKWGQFNEPHYGVMPFRINTGERLNDYFGFVDAERRVRTWATTGSREQFFADPTFNLYYPLIQKPYHYDGGDEGTVLSSSGLLSTFPTRVMTQRAGYYQSDGLTPVPPVLTGLDASIQIGFFRSSKDMAYDELSEVSQILVRSTQTGPIERTSTNFNLAPPPAFDFNLPDESAVYGFNEINYVNHKLSVIPTVDGVSVFNGIVNPDLVAFSRGARHYSCTAIGIWHIVEIRAEDVGEAFHLKTLEFTATSAGRLI